MIRNRVWMFAVLISCFLSMAVEAQDPSGSTQIGSSTTPAMIAKPEKFVPRSRIRNVAGEPKKGEPKKDEPNQESPQNDSTPEPSLRDPFSTSPRMEDEFIRRNGTGPEGGGGVPVFQLRGYGLDKSGKAMAMLINGDQHLIVYANDDLFVNQQGRTIDCKVRKIDRSGVTIEVISTGRSVTVR